MGSELFNKEQQSFQIRSGGKVKAFANCFASFDQFFAFTLSLCEKFTGRIGEPFASQRLCSLDG